MHGGKLNVYGTHQNLDRYMTQLYMFEKLSSYRINRSGIFINDFFDDDDIKSILKKGGLIFGMAGTGKSTTSNRIKDALATDCASPSVLKTCAYTHKASEIVDGNTLHLLLGIDMKHARLIITKIKSYVNQGRC